MDVVGSYYRLLSRECLIYNFISLYISRSRASLISPRPTLDNLPSLQNTTTLNQNKIANCLIAFSKFQVCIALLAGEPLEKLYASFNGTAGCPVSAHRWFNSWRELCFVWLAVWKGEITFCYRSMIFLHYID